MHIEPLGVALSVASAVVAVLVLVNRDDNTPLRVLIWRQKWFVLAAFAFPLVVLQGLAPLLPVGPLRSAAIGGAAFAGMALASAYLSKDPAVVRRGFVGAAVYVVAFVAADVVWPA